MTPKSRLAATNAKWVKMGMRRMVFSILNGSGLLDVVIRFSLLLEIRLCMISGVMRPEVRAAT
jgi:hypothetical protein